MELNARIFIAGHNGMVGSAILRKLQQEGYTNIVTKSSKELDLRDSACVSDFFKSQNIKYVFLAAAKVGGIMANKKQPASFIYDNLMIQNNVIHQSYLNKIEKLVFLGSSCIYPKMAAQPIKEEYLLSDKLEETNKSYALAKIAGIEMCDAYRKQYGCNFISAMPTNLYGPNDNYDLNSSHVIPALLRKFYEAKNNNKPSVMIWGDGSPLREFLHVDDCASACYFLMKNFYESGAVNVGTGSDLSIKDLALLISDKIGFKGDITFDTSKPNGTPKKQLDVSKINKIGWKSSITLDEGIKSVCTNLKTELASFQ